VCVCIAHTIHTHAYPHTYKYINTYMLAYIHAYIHNKHRWYERLDRSIKKTKNKNNKIEY
jgi:hypothetical protein